MTNSGFLNALIGLSAGIGHWFLAGIAQRLASRGLARFFGGGSLATLLANAALEELLRIALIGAAAYTLTRHTELTVSRRTALLYAFALLAGWAFGSMENLSYLLAFPSSDIFWRLGYSLPIHLNAGILYAIALFPPSPKGGSGRRSAAGRALRAAAALCLGIAWHGAFNAFASLGFFSGLPALGSALNALAFLALALLAEHHFVSIGAFHGRTRA